MARPRNEPSVPATALGETVLLNIGAVEDQWRPAIIVKHVVYGEGHDHWSAIAHLLVLESDLPLPFGVRAWDEKHGLRVQIDPSNHGNGCGQWRGR